MTDIHILIYGVLVLIIAAVLFFLYRPLEIRNFDREFAASVGMPVGWLDAIVSILLVLAIVVGIRSVGVVLMSGMLIAPAVAARQFTNRLSTLFFYSGLIGLASGFFGNYLSVELPHWLNERGLAWKFTLPTGPMILLCASFFAFVSLLAAPERGLLSRFLRIVKFRSQCRLENALKAFWKKGRGGLLTFSEIAKSQEGSSLAMRLLLAKLTREGWVERSGRYYSLSPGGWHRASHIVRLHRLWEAYLVYLGQGVEKVHGSAEEMEHILTPELERELTVLLQDPRQDPHKQPIPARDGLL